MTQALALSRILRNAGHEVAGALVGRSTRREVPAFFVDKIQAPVRTFSSPNFVTDGHNRSISLAQTVLKTARLAREYRLSLRAICVQVAMARPDVIVNFYEPLCGVFYGMDRPPAPLVCVGHQYLVHHPQFPLPSGSPVSRAGLRLFTDTTAIGAAARLGLSFRPLPDLPEKRLVVVPPLLRAEIFEQSCRRDDPFILVYVLNAGYGEQIIRWHERNPSVVIECFWDNGDVPNPYWPHANLTFHQLDDRKFLSMMGRCAGLVCTAGFESVCEAMYLNKPVMLVPVEGHYEQACNALDAVQAGAGIAGREFDLSRFLPLVDGWRADPGSFRGWAEAAAARFVSILEEIGGVTAGCHPASVLSYGAREPVTA